MIQLLLLIKNRLKVLVREAKLAYLQTLLYNTKKDPTSSAHLWAGVNNVIGRDSSNHHSAIDSKRLSLDDINEFFHNVAITINHQPASSFTPNINTNAILVINFVLILLISGGGSS